MAVEIPVVIDIDQAFADAAKKVKTASTPLRRSIEELNEALSEDLKLFNTLEVNDPLFRDLAKDIQSITYEMELVNDQFLKFSTNEGSIRRMNGELASLNRRWEEMGSAQKFASNGELTDDAKKLKEEYKSVIEEIKKTGKTLAQLEEEERRSLDLTKKKLQTYRDENRILNTTVKTMRILREQERILSSRLQSTPIGSEKFKKLSARLAEVRKEMAQAEAMVRRGGNEFRNLGNSAQIAATHIKGASSALSEQGGIFRKLAGYVSGYTLLFTGVRFAHNIRETTAELELQRVALGGILQDTSRANDLFRQIKAAALKSPFEIKDLVTYTKQLSAYRIESDKLYDTTMKLADVSAGLGVDMSRLILAYGQVRAAAVLRGQELRQFTEAGIPLVDLLAEKFKKLGREGTTTADVFDLISKRAVPFSMIEEIFNDMTEAGGMFYKMQEKQSETLKGQWMKLRDSITIMYDEMGNTGAVHDAMIALIKTANNLTRSWKVVAEWVKAITTMIVTYNLVSKASAVATNALTAAEARRLAVTKAQTVVMPKFVASILGETAAKKTSIWVTKRLEIAQYKLATATTVAEKSFWRLWAAIIKNPYALAGAAVIGLVAGIVALVKNSKEAAITTDELDESLTRFSSAAGKASDTARLIAAYEELSVKAEKSAEDNERLKRTSEELAKTYPTAVSGINAESGALEINIEKVRELIDAEQELELNRLRRNKERAKEQIKTLEEERDRILEDYKRGGRYSIDPAEYNVDPSSVLVPWTEKELDAMSERLRDIRKELDPLLKQVKQIEEIDFIGPLPASSSQAQSSFSGWKKVLQEIQTEKVKAGAPTIFSDGDIQNMKTIHDLWKAVKKGIAETKTEMTGLSNIQKTLTAEEFKKQNEEALELTKKQMDLYKAIKAAFGFVFGKESDTYKKDAFVTAMENRIKFMKDFKKGYEDLKKYMSEESSLGTEGGIMLFRGQSLGLSPEEQSRAATELSDWYQDQINSVVEEMRRKGFAVSDIGEILSKEITGTGNRAKMQRDFQKLLQSLWDAKTDLDTSTKKKEIEDALKKLENEIKRSETARNFFQDIFDMTGDEQLAANMAVSVYGEPGKELADRIRESIQGAMSAEGSKIDSDTWSRLVGAAEKMDFRDVMKDISSLPEGVQKAVQEASSAIEKYNADIAKSYAKLLMSYDDIEQERVNINQQAARKIKAIESGLQLELRAIAERGGDEGAASAARKRAAEAMLAVEREQRSELYKLTDEYRLFFNTVNILSVENARSIAAKQKKILADRLANEEISFARYKRELKEIDEQLKKYENRTSPFLLYLKDGLEALMEQSKEAAEDIQGLAASIGKSSIGDGGVFSPDASARAFLDKCDRVFNKGLFARIFHGKNTITIEQRISAASTQAYNEAYYNAIMRGKSDDVAKAIAQSQAASAASAEASSAAAEAAGAASSAASGVAWAEFWIRLIYSVLSNIDERITKGGKEAAPKWLDYLASGVTWTWGKVGEGAWDKLADVNSHAIKWLEEVKSGDLAGSLFTFGDAIYDIFRSKSVREANREINEQSKIITDLERSYSRLEVAIQDAFGSDYIYNFNKQLELLEIEAEAYRKQAESERSKGKDADEDVAKGYERSAEDVENKIKDMRSQLADFFSGTDAASAAKDFAEAWIEAYKEFGSTTDAISQKFNDMIESMVVNSLAAQLIQGVLNPVFEAIDTASKDGALTADDIGAISAMVPGRVAMINDAMNTLMSQLLSTGIDLQRQAGNFTGISRNIAGASEESILSLAAGINTQNYYMSHIDINVASILAAITGDETAGQNRAKSSGPTSVQYNEQMLEYASSIPMMRDDMASVRAMLERVIKPVGTPASHYVSARV